MTRASLTLACLLLAACAPDALRPIDVRLGEDACAHCRMTLVSIKTASQIVAPGAEPLLFDDLACLNEYLVTSTLPADAVVFVADHRTSEWIDYQQVVITRTGEPTPMGSGLVARARTPAGKGATP